jgi:hypothetical protein
VTAIWRPFGQGQDAGSWFAKGSGGYSYYKEDDAIIDQLSSIFRKGLTDDSLRQIAGYATCSALILIVLYLPVWVRRRNRRKAGTAIGETGE